MSEQKIRFEDGVSYERMMGTWSRLVGGEFLRWLAPRSGLRLLDVGCGNGAFTELLVERCASAEIHGIDPSEGQLAFARCRPATRIAEFHQGHAMELPFPDSRFDAAVMALVIFYVPDPAKAVAEMARVVAPSGTVADLAAEGAAASVPPHRIAGVPNRSNPRLTLTGAARVPLACIARFAARQSRPFRHSNLPLGRRPSLRERRDMATMLDCQKPILCATAIVNAHSSSVRLG